MTTTPKRSLKVSWGSKYSAYRLHLACFFLTRHLPGKQRKFVIPRSVRKLNWITTRCIYKNKCIFRVGMSVKLFFGLVEETRKMTYFYMQKNRVANMSTV